MSLTTRLTHKSAFRRNTIRVKKLSVSITDVETPFTLERSMESATNLVEKSDYITPWLQLVYHLRSQARESPSCCHALSIRIVEVGNLLHKRNLLSNMTIWKCCMSHHWHPLSQVVTSKTLKTLPNHKLRHKSKLRRSMTTITAHSTTRTVPSF